MVVPVSFPGRPGQAQLSAGGLGEDDTGVVEVHGVGGGASAGGAAAPRVQGELEAGRRRHGGRGRAEDRSVDGPGVGGQVDRVVVVRRLLLLLRPLVLVGGKQPQGTQCGRVVLGRVGGGQAEERHGHLGQRRLLQGSTVGGLRGARRLGGILGDGGGLRRVGRSLPTV